MFLSPSSIPQINNLVVDSLKPTEIVVSMSALCHWNDPVPPPAVSTGPEPKSSTRAGGKADRTLESRMADAAQQQHLAADNSIERTAAASGWFQCHVYTCSVSLL
jgi:hypothetical protein